MIISHIKKNIEHLLLQTLVEKTHRKAPHHHPPDLEDTCYFFCTPSCTTNLTTPKQNKTTQLYSLSHTTSRLRTTSNKMSKLSVQDVLIMSGPIYILLLLLFSSSSTDGFVNDNRYLATGSGSGSSRLFSQIEDQSSSSSSYTTTTSKNKYQNIITTSSSDDDDDWVEKSLSKQTTAPTFSSSKLASFVKGPKECLVFDTTLRDGTQGELVSASCDDKLKIATRLAAFDVDYIEAGWPGSNPKVRFMLLY